MKKIVLLISLYLLATSCKKQSPSGDDNGGQGPDFAAITSGYLCTMGKGRDGHIDTLTYLRHDIEEMTMYGKDYQKPEDELSFISDGNGHVYIKRKGVYKIKDIVYQYFGIEENKLASDPFFPEHKYRFNFYQPAKSITNLFTIKRNTDDNKKFTIESVAYPGYFLGTARWKYEPYPTETRLVFTANAQVFFFL